MSENNSPEITITRLPHAQELPLPAYESAGAAGMDLRAACEEDRPIIIKPSKRVLVPTGLVIEIPVGFEGQIRPRSGLALKYGLTCLNTPGTIDSDYRGEVMVLLINHGEENFTIERGMRMAQMIIAPAIQAEIIEADLASADRDSREKTGRGAGGFGSTGV